MGKFYLLNILLQARHCHFSKEITEIIASSRVRVCDAEVKQKDTAKTTLRKVVSTQHLLFRRVFQVIYFCEFLPARKSASVKCCCFSLWPGDAAFSEDAEMHCSYSGLGIYVPFSDAKESTGLNDEQAPSALLPIKKLIVCPLWRGNDPLGLHTHANSNSNATAFDFVNVHTERQCFVPACSSCLCQF